MNKHQSDSTVQVEAEETIRRCFFEEKNVVVEPRTILLNGSKVFVDGVCDEPRWLAEIYAHVGKLRGAQPKKIAQDILKLVTIRAAVPDWTESKLTILFADNDAMQCVASSWLGTSATLHGVELYAVTLPESVKNSILEAQSRQAMTNA